MNETGIGKIVELEVIEEALADARDEGRKIVLCHGVFDLLHVGHNRHLEQAKEFGDVLVVSITADEHVNKGPDRPAFAAELRSEMLAALSVVDFVTIVHEPSATPSIMSVRPDFYVKGREYASAENDITKKIIAERDLVERLGGQIVYTDGITFSSSNLLNRHFSMISDGARDFIAEARKSGIEERLSGLLEKLKDMKILVVGECIIDRYVYVEPMGKAAKENIIAARQREQEVFAGGAIAIANHIAAICPHVELVTMIGDSSEPETYEAFVRERLDENVRPRFLHKSESPTVEKIRFVEPTYVRKLFEVYQMNDTPLSDDGQQRLHDLLDRPLQSADVVVVADFGHGMFQQPTIDMLHKNSRFLALNVQTNAGNIGYNLLTKHRGGDFVCVDAMEARLASSEKHLDLPKLLETRLPHLIECSHMIVTHGRAGCYALDREKDAAVHVPAFTNGVVDTVGAGDAFFVVAAGIAAAGGDTVTAACAGNVAGALAANIVGHRRYLTLIDIQRYITTLMK